MCAAPMKPPRQQRVPSVPLLQQCVRSHSTASPKGVVVPPPPRLLQLLLPSPASPAPGITVPQTSVLRLTVSVLTVAAKDTGVGHQSAPQSHLLANTAKKSGTGTSAAVSGPNRQASKRLRPKQPRPLKFARLGTPPRPPRHVQCPSTYPTRASCTGCHSSQTQEQSYLSWDPNTWHLSRLHGASYSLLPHP